ncbi:Hsp20/alpha crystallin family protein [Natrinema sp. LN54]|uniref:Hsp20/alpha crystallin family protein n=1 Tax=Natrinema sp. LN54 TaxID=3458705 RepID=UPI00403590FA
MSSPSQPRVASFPYPMQFVYEGPADRLRAAVDVAPAAIDDVTVEVGSRRVRIAVDCDGDIAERTVTPLPPGLAFGDDRQASYNNGVLTLSIETES